MDGYFVFTPPPIMIHTPYAPEAIAAGNSYQINHSVISGFWSVRDLWLEEQWSAQSESACASFSAQVQPPAFIPQKYVLPVVMLSW